MPVDLSDEKMGGRVLNLLDDMSNWNATKYALDEVDVFDISHDYEVYGAMNINYLKLDTLPTFGDGWQPVLDVLREGNFFVSTGEIVLNQFTINGQECGSTLSLNASETATLKADLAWTFPMNYLEIVTGDGEKVYRERIDLSTTPSFGQQVFDVNVDLSNRTWVRFEAWDVATNVTFTQPLWISHD